MPAADARYTLEVRTSNSGAIAMYERFGFRPAGHRRRYYHDNGEDALIMWLASRPAVGAVAPVLNPCASRRPATTPARRSSTAREILSNVISSQAAAHARFGGVVPEVASRHHLELANAVVDAALDDAGTTLGEVDALAVTRGPGLIGALLVGVSTAKALAAATRKPLIGVDHLQGHVAANFLEPEPLQPPFLCLIASGGHTLLAGVRDHGSHDVLGQTLDDAAGEALDKGARMLGLGYPGGPAIERSARGGRPRRLRASRSR